jgi:hypothetical protein
MATKPLAPRGDEEGGIGVPGKRWGDSHIKSLTTSGLSGYSGLPISVGPAQDLAQIASPGAPAAGRTRVFAKADGNIYIHPAGGVEQLIGISGYSGASGYSGSGVSGYSGVAGGVDIVNDTTPQLGGNLDVNGKTITSVSNGDVLIQPDGSGSTVFGDTVVKTPVLQDISEKVNVIGTGLSGAQTIDYTLGGVVTATVTGAAQWTVTNPPASGKCGTIVFHLTNGGLGIQTLFSGNAVKWPGGTAPTLTSSGTDMLVFTTLDAGTTWRGVLSGADFK